MAQLTKQSLTKASCVAWIVDNKFITERLELFEFTEHRFLIDYMADDHDDIVSTKAAQIGATLAETFDDVHLAGERGMNVIHTLQNSDVIKGFVVPKVDPIINNNPVIKGMLKSDSQNLKQFNENYVFFRGANAESQAINISADVLKIDELDRSDQKVVNTFESRLDYSKISKVKRFSNPSSKGFGVDALWVDSDQRHWFIKCHHCGWEWFIDFEANDDHRHYVDKIKAIFACGKCKKELSNADRICGRWVAKYPSRSHRHGYWFSQMMSPWFSAARIIKKWRDLPIDVFYNFTLGKAYTPSDLSIDREAILKACSPSAIVKTPCAMGVDNGVVKTWVLGTPAGIFAHGRTESWDEIEKLKLMYNAVTVIDPNPYPTTPKKLVDKYKGDIFICYFKETKTTGILDWGTGDKFGVVYADRTKSIDVVANEIVSADIMFRETPYELEDYIEQWGNIYRATEEEDDGRVVSRWLKKEGKLNDYALATTYWRIALSRIIGNFGESRMVEPQFARKPRADVVKGDQLVTDLGQRIEDALNGDDYDEVRFT